MGRQREWLQSWPERMGWGSGSENGESWVDSRKMWEVTLTELGDGLSGGMGGCRESTVPQRTLGFCSPGGGLPVPFLRQELGLAQVGVQSRSHASIGWGGVNLRCCWDVRSGERSDRQSKGRRSAVQRGGQNHVHNELPFKRKCWICPRLF